MSALICRTVRPANLQKWIAANAPGSLKPHPMDSWRAYLVSVGGTGKTLADLERSASITALSAGPTFKEKCRNTFN